MGITGIYGQGIYGFNVYGSVATYSVLRTPMSTDIYDKSLLKPYLRSGDYPLIKPKIESVIV